MSQSWYNSENTRKSCFERSNDMRQEIDRIPLTKERASKVSKIFQHPVDNGFCYSVYLKTTDEVFWCDTISEIYAIIDKN